MLPGSDPLEANQELPIPPDIKEYQKSR